MPGETTRGLVPRSSIFIAVVGFALLLAGFAAVDIYRSGNPTAPNVNAEKPAQAMTATPAPAPPPASDIKNIAEAQAAKADADARTQPMPSDKLSERTRGPADAQTSATPGGPLLAASQRHNEDGAAPTAKDEREAAAAVSGLFAMEGGGGVASAIQQSGLPGSAAVAGAVDPIQSQIDELMKTASQPTAQPDAGSEIVKAIAGLQGTQNATRMGKDQAWLKETAAIKTADATYAKLPASPWMVMQGTRVPLVTREALNSDLPGDITAMSTAPVYDSINQCAVMIPPGTTFIGSYSADIRPGQQRMILAYRRLIFPDGRSVDLDGAQGVDQRGTVGIAGKVDNHFLSMFGYGFAIALLADRATGGGAGVTTTQPSGASTTTTVAGQVISDIGGRILTRNAVIAPTIEIDVGTRMFVTIVRDIALTPISTKRCK